MLKDAPRYLPKQIPTRDSHAVWTAMQAQYMPTIIAEYKHITHQMEDLFLDNPYKDPSYWMHQSNNPNICLGTINPRNRKSDL